MLPVYERNRTLSTENTEENGIKFRKTR